jgi:hypothetical protein
LMPTLLIAICRVSALLWTSGMGASVGEFMSGSQERLRGGLPRPHDMQPSCNRLGILAFPTKMLNYRPD